MAKKKLKKKTATKPSSKSGINQFADPVLDSARDIWRAGLGALAMAQKESGKVMEQGTALFDKLVAEGARLEEEGRKATDDSVARVRKGAAGVRDDIESRLGAARKQAEDRWDKLESVFEQRVARAMAGLGVPSADDLNRLSAQVERLGRQVAELAEQRQAAAKAAAKPAAKAVAKKSGDAVYHLVPSDDGWAVRAEGSKSDLSVHGTKREGLEAARGVAQAHEPSRLVVHKTDGTIQTSYHYGDD